MFGLLMFGFEMLGAPMVAAYTSPEPRLAPSGATSEESATGGLKVIVPERQVVHPVSVTVTTNVGALLTEFHWRTNRVLYTDECGAIWTPSTELIGVLKSAE